MRFETTIVGKYTVEVFWSGKLIPNSPFTFETTDISKVAISSNLTETKPIVGKDISYDIKLVKLVRVYSLLKCFLVKERLQT